MLVCDTDQLQPHSFETEDLARSKSEDGRPQSIEVSWKPNHENLFMDDEKRIQDMGLNLGSSVLFGNSINKTIERSRHSDTESEYVKSEEEDDFYVFSPTKKTPYLVRNAICDLFARNPHPTASEMNELREIHPIRYKTIFETMERKREARNIICEEGDNCDRIRGYIRHNKDPLVWPNMDQVQKQYLEKLIEDHICTGKKFELGCVHVIMEKTNLSSAVVRSFYAKWKKRLHSSSGSSGYSIEEWRRNQGYSNQHAKVFTYDSLRKLEDAYLKKKYESADKEWKDQDILQLSVRLGNIAPERITAWINDRNKVAQDIFYRDPPLGTIREYCPWSSNKIPKNKLESLREGYVKNTRPTKAEYEQIASNLELRETTVRGFYNKCNMSARRKDEWEQAKYEINKLEPDKAQMMENVAADRTMRANEQAVWADKIGISYRSLRCYIEWKKSLKSRRPSIYKNV